MTGRGSDLADIIDGDVDDVQSFVITRIESLLNKQDTLVTISRNQINVCHSTAGRLEEEISSIGVPLLTPARILIQNQSTEIEIVYDRTQTTIEDSDSVLEIVREICDHEDPTIYSRTGMDSAEPIYTTTRITPVGFEGREQATIAIDAQYVGSITVEMDTGKATTWFDSDDDTGNTSASIWIEDLPMNDSEDLECYHDDEHEHDSECPVCQEPFSRETWTYIAGYGDRAGATSIYSCPRNGCSGEASVTI